MNIRKKIAIDRTLGIVLALPLNYLVRFVGFITRFDHSLKAPKKNIAICKFKGMGSILQSTPLIDALKQKYPEANITFISSVENKAILSEIKSIDEVLFVNDSSVFSLLSSTTRLIYRSIRKKFDLYIDLEIYSNYSSIVATMSMATDRFGYYLKTSRYRMGMYTHMMYFNPSAPITDVYLQFARLLKCDQINYHPEIFDSSVLQVNQEKIIVVNVNASDLRIERRWPLENFKKLIEDLLVAYPDREVYLIGAKSEHSYVKSLHDSMDKSDRLIDVSGQTSISALISLIAKAELVITNDTGPMHLSSALKKNTVALFGPCSPDQYAIGETIHPVYMNLYCSPCVHEFIVPPCKGNNSCMKMMSVQIVFNKVKEVLNQNTSTEQRKSKVYTSNEEITLGTVERSNSN